jgi:hypothetical protein
MAFNPLHLLYLPRRVAIEYGMTHEGWLFGVPAWIAQGSHNNELIAVPKIQILQLWALLADAVLGLATYFMREDQSFEAPIRIVRPIGGSRPA